MIEFLHQLLNVTLFLHREDLLMGKVMNVLDAIQLDLLVQVL